MHCGLLCPVLQLFPPPDWKSRVSMCRSAQSQITSPSARRSGADSNKSAQRFSSPSRSTLAATPVTARGASPGSSLEGVHSLLSRLTSSPSRSPYRAMTTPTPSPSSSPPGGPKSSARARFNSFLDKKTAAVMFDSPAERTRTQSPCRAAGRAGGRGDTPAGRNLDISEL